MTWRYSFTGLGTTEQTIHIEDHTGSEVYVETREAWSADDARSLVLDTMHMAVTSAIQERDFQRGLTVLVDMAGEQIERAE